jgi:hypothetical protein
LWNTNSRFAFGGYHNFNKCTEEYDGSAWTAGGNLATGRYALAGAGIQTAGLAFGGFTHICFNMQQKNITDLLGQAGGNLGTARRRLAGAGTQTAGLAFGGFTTTDLNATEEYDGTSWTGGGNLNTAREYLAGAGTQTAGL